jgi:hypothetical protein
MSLPVATVMIVAEDIFDSRPVRTLKAGVTVIFLRTRDELPAIQQLWPRFEGLGPARAPDVRHSRSEGRDLCGAHARLTRRRVSFIMGGCSSKTTCLPGLAMAEIDPVPGLPGPCRPPILVRHPLTGGPGRKRALVRRPGTGARTNHSHFVKDATRIYRRRLRPNGKIRRVPSRQGECG